mmetsp:Transcript_41651/g.118801  ORF Transcript_41651/g.118801 Transcript_41651/m.118801 type:complete len:253 (-) Transcript_41651:594-1352(-)
MDSFSLTPASSALMSLALEVATWAPGPWSVACARCRLGLTHPRLLKKPLTSPASQDMGTSQLGTSQLAWCPRDISTSVHPLSPSACAGARRRPHLQPVWCRSRRPLPDPDSPPPGSPRPLRGPAPQLQGPCAVPGPRGVQSHCPGATARRWTSMPSSPACSCLRPRRREVRGCRPRVPSWRCSRRRASCSCRSPCFWSSRRRCGSSEMCTASSPTCCGSWTLAAPWSSLISFWVTTWTAASSRWRQWCCCWP